METEKTWRELSTAADNRRAALEIAKLARRQLAIFSHDLEPQVLDTPEMLAAVKQLALSGSQARVRILLIDSGRAIRDGHRLVGLARRLSSYIEIRKPHRDYLGLAEAFMVADEKGLLLRTLATRWEGIVDPNDPMQARDRLKLFDEIWQRSHSDPETRQLRI